MTNKIDFTEMFDAIQMDVDAKKVFLSMQRDEQLLAILGMQAWMREEQSKIMRRVIDIERDLHTKKGSNYREDDRKLTTSQKIMNVLTKRFDFWLDIFKGVLQTVLTVVTLAILYLAFGGKLPTP